MIWEVDFGKEVQHRILIKESPWQSWGTARQWEQKEKLWCHHNAAELTYLLQDRSSSTEPIRAKISSLPTHKLIIHWPRAGPRFSLNYWVCHARVLQKVCVHICRIWKLRFTWKRIYCCFMVPMLLGAPGCCWRCPIYTVSSGQNPHCSMQLLMLCSGSFVHRQESEKVVPGD